MVLGRRSETERKVSTPQTMKLGSTNIKEPIKRSCKIGENNGCQLQSLYSGLDVCCITSHS